MSGQDVSRQRREGRRRQEGRSLPVLQAGGHGEAEATFTVETQGAQRGRRNIGRDVNAGWSEVAGWEGHQRRPARLRILRASCVSAVSLFICRRGILALCVSVLAACAGGRGSSGFDISEQRVIDEVLETGECNGHEQLLICPAGSAPSVPTLTPTPTGPVVVTPTSTPDQSVTPTATAAPALPTPTASPSEPPPRPLIVTGLDDDVAVPCVTSADGASCQIAFAFRPAGFAEGTSFRVALRRVTPNSTWTLAAAPIRGEDGSFVTSITLDMPARDPATRVQLVVLGFLRPPQLTATQYAELSATGADYGFVTQSLLVELVTGDATATPSPERTPLPPEEGPEITFFGIARADDVALNPTGFDESGRPVFSQKIGGGFSLIIEARPGGQRRAVGQNAVDFEGNAPDLQILVSRPLGNGDPMVCDIAPPTIGGVQGTPALEFSTAPEVLAALNDLGCRVNDGTGRPVARSSSDPCTRDAGGNFRFVDDTSTVQYCLPIASAWSFPEGDTIVAVRVRDVGGTVGLTRHIVVRIGTTAPTPTSSTPTQPPTSVPPTMTPVPPGTAPPSPTRTPQPSSTPTGPVSPDLGPQLTYFGVARADGSALFASEVDAEGRPIYPRPLGRGFILIIEARPGAERRPVGRSAFDPDRGLPDLQLIVSRPLGNGDPEVCDIIPPEFGGVPATVPLEFSDRPTVIAAINDLGCRTNDGAGNPMARVTSGEACTKLGNTGEFGFVDPASTVQYCIPIASAWAFPGGDTIAAARVRDSGGVVGRPREIVVRVDPARQISSGSTGEAASAVLAAEAEAAGSGGASTLEAFCPGDCDGDGVVSVSELVLAVNIALGARPIGDCPGADQDDNQMLTIDELVQDVRSATEGCAPPEEPTRTSTAPPSATETATPTSTPSPTSSSTPPSGPQLTYLGVATAAGVALLPDEYDEHGRPVYVRPQPQGFTLIVEARPGSNRRSVGATAFAHDPFDPNSLPDLQVILSRPLGDGSPAVCDITEPAIGGVPAMEPFAFLPTPLFGEVVNDLGCRTDGGRGAPVGRTALQGACTLSESDDAGGFGFVSPETTMQFCIPIALKWAFSPGDTIVAARVRDVSGEVGEAQEMVIRVPLQ